ncbi:hypothetical protein OOZ19_07900 [Saccharopolyspora sp. NFXS83]|uniref:hypothetical protein n=1 Tax=Saccharopolyspora sp. NFXS83 TaxID=2993560 RepID=UPI00224AE007|nr:hypothetical protein [Saccharopolyspora sp. NFXS83]MCX2730161.1 hypothetical protein [Saccharopolyspora sp. NFXS83]
MRRTAATLVATAGLLAGSVGQAAAVGSWAEEPVPTTAETAKLTAAGSARGESWAFGYNGGNPKIQTSAVYRKGEQGWQEVPLDSIGPLGDGAVLAPNDVWTIGMSAKTGSGSSAHWDGQKWTRIGLDPLPGKYVRPLALKAFASDDVWTVGQTYSTRGLAQHWDGAAWTDVPVPVLENGGYSLVDVDGVATDDLWSVGSVPSTSRSVALHWDGATWAEVPAPDFDPNPDVPEALTNVLALAADDVWVGGHTGESQQKVPYTAHWDGTGWEVFNLHESGHVTDLIQVGDQVQLFAIGPNLEPLWRIWEGSSWQGALAPPSVRVEGAAVQDDGAVLGVGYTGSGDALEPYTATYHE